MRQGQQGSAVTSSNGGGPSAPAQAATPQRYVPKRGVPSGEFEIVWRMTSSPKRETPGLEDWHGRLFFTPRHATLRRTTDDRDANGNEDEHLVRMEAGFIHCVKVDAARVVDAGLMRREDIGTQLRAHSNGLRAFAALFDWHNRMIPVHNNVACEAGERWEITQGTLLLVDKVVVCAELRGLGLGLLLVHEACEKINQRTSLTVVKPEPLDEQGNAVAPAAGRSATAARFGRACGKLRAHYELLGFYKLGEQFVGRWNGYVVPSAREVCPHLFL